MPTPGDGASFLDLVLQLKLSHRRWNLVCTSRLVNPDSTELDDELRFLKRSNGGHFRVLTPAPKVIPLLSYTLPRIRKEPYDLKDNLDNSRIPQNNVNFRTMKGLGQEGRSGMAKERRRTRRNTVNRRDPVPRTKNAGSNRKGAPDTAKHSARAPPVLSRCPLPRLPAPMIFFPTVRGSTH